MNLVKNVFEITEAFMEKPKDVFLSELKIYALAEIMEKEGPTKFPTKESESEYKDCLLELVGNSINYCYWYGKHNIRPNGCSSTKMYELLQTAFEDFTSSKYFKLYNSFSQGIDMFVKLISLSRFPLLEERIKHLNELKEFGVDFIDAIIDKHDDKDFDMHFTNLVGSFPGYGSDIFLKRASLFFLQLNRRFGWFKETMKELHVPADYQVPHILNHFGCINYSRSLKEIVNKSSLIPKHSKEECEIRAATILACKKLCEITGWSISDVDGWLWLKRNLSVYPFHLTITTDY